MVLCKPDVLNLFTLDQSKKKIPIDSTRTVATIFRKVLSSIMSLFFLSDIPDVYPFLTFPQYLDSKNLGFLPVCN